MKDKTKKALLITVCSLLCVALIVGIGVRLAAPATIIDTLPNDTEDEQGSVSVDIDVPDTQSVNVQINTPGSDTVTDPGAGADSSGTEQTIQGTPEKPDEPETPTLLDADHSDNDVAEADRNTETPPTYQPEQTTVTTPSEPEAGSTNSQGQMYVPGFGYISGGGESTIDHNSDMYENGNKVGIMD